MPVIKEDEMVYTASPTTDSLDTKKPKLITPFMTWDCRSQMVHSSALHYSWYKQLLSYYSPYATSRLQDELFRKE